MDVSFVRSGTLSAFTALLANSGAGIVPGTIYIVTVSANPLIVSLFRGIVAAPYYEVLNGNMVATQPILAANGMSLSYKDAGGNDKVIDLTEMTVGDNTAPNSPLPSGDGELFAGVILNGDSIGEAIMKLNNRMDDEFAGFATDADINTLRGEVATMFASILDFQGSVDTQLQVRSLTTLKTGETYRVNTAGTFNLLNAQLVATDFVCEVGDLLICINIAGDSSGAQCGWTVLQNNVDFTAVFSGVSANTDGSKMLVSLSYANGVMTTAYASLIGRTLTGWAATADVGNITAADTLVIALSRLQNRVGTLETASTKHTGQLTWTII